MMALSSRRSPNELFPVMSFHAISLVDSEPRPKTPKPLSLIPLLTIVVTTVLLMPLAVVAAPQSVAATGVLAFVPTELVVTPQVLAWMLLLRSVAVLNVIRLLPGALMTPTPLSWMWLLISTVFVDAEVGAIVTPDWNL